MTSPSAGSRTSAPIPSGPPRPDLTTLVDLLLQIPEGAPDTVRRRRVDAAEAVLDRAADDLVHDLWSARPPPAGDDVP